MRMKIVLRILLLTLTAAAVLAEPIIVPPSACMTFEYEYVWYPEDMSMLGNACENKYGGDIYLPGFDGGYFSFHWTDDHWHCGCIAFFEQ